MAPRCDRAVLELLVGRGQDATTHPVMHRTAPTAENCLVPYVAGAEAEKPEKPGSYQELPLGRSSALFPALLASNLRIPSPPPPRLRSPPSSLPFMESGPRHPLASQPPYSAACAPSTGVAPPFILSRGRSCAGLSGRSQPAGCTRLRRPSCLLHSALPTP